MNGNFKRNLVISSTISIAILIISSTASFISIRSLLSSNAWVTHTQDVIYNLNAGTSVMIDAQTSMRGYLLTGKQSLLYQYNDAESLADSYIDKLEELTADNADQQSSLKELKPLKLKSLMSECVRCPNTISLLPLDNA